MFKVSNPFIFSFLLPAILGACASPQYNYSAEVTEISRPALGSITTVGVGEEMLVQGKIFERDAIYFPRQYSIRLLVGYTFSAGYYDKVGDGADSEFYIPGGGAEGGRVTRDPGAERFQAIQIMNQGNSVCAVATTGGKACSDNVQFSRSKRISSSNNSFKQTLIYSGKIGRKLNIGYREFLNDRSRPAFSNEVEYDLKESNLIGYKGAELEIIKATNRSIKYKVIRNFNLAAK